MLCDVTNRSRGPRGLQTEAGTTHLVEPGETARLDLADHPLHQAWEAAGEIAIVEIKAEPSATSSTPHPALRSQVYAGCVNLPARATFSRKGRRAPISQEEAPPSPLAGEGVTAIAVMDEG